MANPDSVEAVYIRPFRPGDTGMFRILDRIGHLLTSDTEITGSGVDPARQVIACREDQLWVAEDKNQVIGPLVEVPVMIELVTVSLYFQRKYFGAALEAGSVVTDVGCATVLKTR